MFSKAAFNQVLEVIKASADRGGRSPSAITLVAVTKTQPIEVLEDYATVAREARIPVVFGENYIQEIRDKEHDLPEWSEIHMIGPLQSNKIRDAVEMCDVIESIHSAKTIALTAKEAVRIGKIQRIMLQVNIGRDGRKSGFLPEDIEQAVALCKEHSSQVALEGLMTILPYEEDPESSRPYFCAMRELRKKLRQSGAGENFLNGEILLSMGMSNDFGVAIEEGADIVRVGTALFGERSPS